MYKEKMNKFRINNFLFKITVILLFIFLIGNIFVGSSIWGDAPYFSSENIQYLSLNSNSKWILRDSVLGDVNKYLFLSPYFYIICYIANIFKINNELFTELFFYVPAIILGVVGIWLLTKNYLALVLYFFNTYFLMLLDGGQAGIVLAYGLFPLVFYFFEKNKILVTTLLLFFLSSIDLRVGIIFLLFIFLNTLFNVKNFEKIKNLFFIIVNYLFLSLYWLVPLVLLKSNFSTSFFADINSFKLNHILSFYSPNWYLNQFGITSLPSWFFSFFIFGLLFLVIFKKLNINQKKYLFMFIFFVFLTKGNLKPFGFYYSFLLNKISFFSAFRDSSKFLIPAIFSFVLLISSFELKTKFKWVILVYICVLLSPLFFNKFNYVLSLNNQDKNTEELNKLFQSDYDENYKIAWFPKRSPIAYHSEQKSSFDAKDLSSLSFFSRLNIGRDKFNYLNNSNAIKWYELLGVKYLVLIDNEKNVIQDNESKKEWELLKNNLDKFNLKKLTDFNNVNVYELDYRNKIYGLDNLVLVVGSNNIYDSFFENLGLIFANDGVLNYEHLSQFNYPVDNFYIYFNNSNVNDFALSLIDKNYYIKLKNVDWAKYESNQISDLKYQLLIRNIIFDDLYFNQPVYFSSQKNEQISIDIDLSKSFGENIFAFRVYCHNDFELEYETSFEKDMLSQYCDNKLNQFVWISKVIPEKFKGKIVLNNISGVSIVNSFIFISNNEFKIFEDLAKEVTQNNKVVTFEELKEINNNSKIVDVESEFLESTRYRIKNSLNANWILFSDHYNENWKLDENFSLPVYSNLNIFYSKNINENFINFEIPKIIPIAEKITVFWLISLVIVYLLL